MYHLASARLMFLFTLEMVSNICAYVSRYPWFEATEPKRLSDIVANRDGLKIEIHIL